MIGARFPGEEVRLVEIDVPPPAEGGIFDKLDGETSSRLDSKELANAAEAAIARNYGHAFREFVRFLLEDGGDYAARARRIQARFVQEMVKRGEAAEADTRLLDVFGRVAATAVLADKAGVLPFSKRQARSAIVYAYSRTVKAKEHAQTMRRDAIQSLCDLATDHARCFPLQKGQEVPSRLTGDLHAITKSEKGRDLLCVLPDSFKAIVGPMNVISILAELEENGVLIKAGDSKTRQVKVRGLTNDNRPRLYCFYILKLEYRIM